MAFIALCAVNSTAAAETGWVVVTGQALEINGRNEIPRGLFGVHSMKPTAEEVERCGIESVRLIHPTPDGTPSVPGGAGGLPANLSCVVDCLFDRYQPALQLTDANWQQRLEKLARNYAIAARKTGLVHHAEFWNEPYLNWATKPGVNYAGPLYRTDGIKAGDPMVLKATGEAVAGLVWDREIFYVRRGEGPSLDYVLSSYLPRDAAEGQPVTLGYGAGQARLVDGGTVRLRGGEQTVVKAWGGRDPGQRHYWSGPVNQRLYNEMFAVFGRVVKQTNPEVRVAAGWGFNFFNGDWDCWENLIKPTLDKNHAWIDAIHEHHYGGDSRMVAASYEMAYAYTLARYQRRLEFWNTEAGGHLDPQQPGNVLPQGTGEPATRALAAMTYLLRDISFMLDRVPDKATHRATHQPQENGGDLPAFQLIKPLRGRLLAVENSAASLWSAAATEEHRLSVLLFNDDNGPRTVPVTVKAPQGTAFLGLVERWLASESAELREKPLAATGAVWSGSIALPGKSAVVLVFELSERPALRDTLIRRQYASADVLMPLSGEGTVTTIPLPAGASAKAGRGILRLVCSRPGQSYTVTLNDHSLGELRPDAQILDLPVPTAWLQEANRLRVACADSKAMLLCASLYLEVSVNISSR